MGQIIEYRKFIDDILENTSNDIIIYGRNNCGKTYLQKQIFIEMCDGDIKKALNGDKVFFAHYLDVNRLEKNEVEYINDSSDLDVSAEYFDKVKKRIQSNSPLYNYKLARQWVEKNGSVIKVSKALEFVFSEGGFVISNYNSYSDGIKNVVNILSLLLMIENFIERNKDRIIERPTILIDEIELYLHVSAQIKFVEYLLSIFKNFRFVFSSHSPFLMQRIKNCEMYVLNDNHENLESFDSQYFKNSDDIMNLCFGLNKIPDQLIDFDNYLKDCLKNPNIFTVEKYRRLLEDCRFKDYNFNVLLNSLILEFIENVKTKKNLKKGSELYNAIYS